MPPVAEDFMTAVGELLDEGVGGLTSLRALSGRLAEIAPRQTAASWYRSIKRYRTTGPSEDAALQISRAFGVPRSQLPEVSRKTIAEVDARLRSFVQEVSGEDEGSLARRLEVLEGEVDQLRAMVRGLLVHLRLELVPGSREGDPTFRPVRQRRARSG